MKSIVVDTSIILKWILGAATEPDHAKAINLLNNWVSGNIDLMAPSLWIYEVGNFLGRKLPGEAPAKMALLLDLHMKTIDLTESMVNQCFEWMSKQQVTFYDASYLAVAYAMDTVLLTGDEKFKKKMAEDRRIVLLSDWE